MTETKPATPPLGTTIARASIGVGLAHALFKFLGLAQMIAVGRFLDSAHYEVVYAFAFEGCIFSLFLLGEEVIAPTFLPLFVEEKNTHGERSAWDFVNTLVTLQCFVLIGATGLLMLYPEAAIRLMTGWTPDASSEKYALARTSLVFLAPALVFLSLGSTTYALLNGYKRFFLAALGDSSWKISVLLSVVAGVGLCGFTYRALLAGLVVGSAAKVATHLAGLLPKLRYARPALHLRHPALRKMLYLALPLIAGVLFARGRDVFNNVTVLSYLDTEGLIKANAFGRKIYIAIGWLVPYAVSIAMFPYLCELAERKDLARTGQILTGVGRMLLAIFIPFSAVCAVLAGPIAVCLFQGGAFSALDSQRTAVSIACYILALPAYALEYVISQAFFAHRKMISLTLLGVLSSMLSVAISYIGITSFGADGLSVLGVIALGYVLSRTLKAIALIAILKRSIPMFPWAQSTSFLVRVCIAALICAALTFVIVLLATPLLPALHPRIIAIVQLALGGLTALGAYMACVTALQIEEPRQIGLWIATQLRPSPQTQDNMSCPESAAP